jgi:Ran GTPase-activating protein (RanGAP) involved in mRNA processing and transport
MPDHYSMGGVGSKEIDTPGPFNAMDSQKMGLTNSFSPNTYFKTSETLSKPIDFKPIDFANKGVSPRKAARIAKTQMKLQQAKSTNQKNFYTGTSKEARMQKRLNRLQK